MGIFGGTIEEENPDLFTGQETLVNELEVITKEDEKMLEFLKDYTPERVTDGYEVIKGTFDCIFNHARIEEYSGEDPKFQGHKFVRYEVEVCEGQEKAGRRFWKSVDLNDEKKVKKLADMIWTVTGLDFKDEETLLKALEQLVTLTVEVKAWGFIGAEEQAKVDAGEITKEQAEKIQQHIIKGQAKKKGEKASSSVPF